MSSLSSPAGLALRLGIEPSQAQADVMRQFCDPDKNTLEFAGDDERLTERAVALAVLWRLLSNVRSSVIVTGPTKSVVRPFMSFLEQVTQSVDAAMEGQTDWPRWNAMYIHGKPDWDLRSVSPLPAYIDEMEPMKVYTVVALGARSSSHDWMVMEKKLDELRGKPNVKLVRVW